jgi:hypothetical protein
MWQARPERFYKDQLLLFCKAKAFYTILQAFFGFFMGAG